MVFKKREEIWKTIMLKRTIAGSVLVVLVVAFFLLRTISYRFFDLLVYLAGIISTIELLKSFKDGISKIQKALVLVFTLTMYPIASLFRGYTVHYISAYISFILVTSILTKKEDLNSIAKTVFATFYPTIPLLSLIYINAMGKVSLFILVFVISVNSITDIFAYFVGSIIKGRKLCPDISPNKTISGAVGGLIGGVTASLVTYFVFNAFGVNIFEGARFGILIVFLICSGAFISLATQIGDLFESHLKRKLDIKDMGNLIPGHGGMLDRIDGLTFSSLATFILYSFLM